jgi:hypothetical protein
MIAPLLAASLLAFGAPASPADVPEFVVVVNASNAVSSMSRKDISLLFFKKASWANGQAAQPVDRKTEDPVRHAFSKAVLGKDTAEVAAYWNQLIFSGRGSPPAARGTDDEVLAFVRANPAAIGYVRAGIPLGDGVKALKLLD